VKSRDLWIGVFTMEGSTELKRLIGVGTATALIVGDVIAIGIFLTPASMAKNIGSPFWLLVVWLVMGAMALCGALCYGELAARYPLAGGGYVYLREAYGPALAFMYGWMALLVMDPGLTAALAVGLGSHAGYALALSPWQMKGIAVAVIAAVAAVNVIGVKHGAWLLHSLTALKLGLLALIVFWGFGFQLGDWSNFVPFMAQRNVSGSLIVGLAAGMIGAFFSFGGWWDLTKVAGEVHDPARTLPRALFAGVTIVTVVYILITAVFIYLVPIERVSSAETFAAQAGEALFGRLGGELFSLVVVIAILGSLSAIVMSAPRVYFAMARDGSFIQAAAAVHPRFQTPARAIILQAALASLLVTVGTFKQIVSYFIFVVILFIGLTVAALFVIRRKDQDQGEYLTPGYPITPVVFLVLLGLVLVLIAMESPKESLLGVAVVALGLPVYHWIVRKRLSAQTET
jgi:basic amino acid/polyamine antiporter, APA family